MPTSSAASVAVMVFEETTTLAVQRGNHPRQRRGEEVTTANTGVLAKSSTLTKNIIQQHIPVESTTNTAKVMIANKIFMMMEEVMKL